MSHCQHMVSGAVCASSNPAGGAVQKHIFEFILVLSCQVGQLGRDRVNRPSTRHFMARCPSTRPKNGLAARDLRERILFQSAPSSSYPAGRAFQASCDTARSGRGTSNFYAAPRGSAGRDLAGAEPVHLVGATPGQADSSAAVAVDVQQAVDGDRGVQFAADRRAVGRSPTRCARTGWFAIPGSMVAQRSRTAAWSDKSAIHPVGLMPIADRHVDPDRAEARRVGGVAL
jgi:hypothetical protein